MSYETLVAALYGIRPGTPVSGLLAAYKALQKPATDAALSGSIDLAELDSIISLLVNARERLGGVAGSDYRPCPQRSAPADGHLRCLRIHAHSGDHFYAAAWDGMRPQESVRPITVTLDELAPVLFPGQDGQTDVTTGEPKCQELYRSAGLAFPCTVPASEPHLVHRPDISNPTPLLSQAEYDQAAAMRAPATAEAAACTCGVGEAGPGVPHYQWCEIAEPLDPAREAEQDMIQHGEEPVDGADYDDHS
jgi:hypothetical protein